MSSSKGYKEIKNMLHNELGLTKDEVRLIAVAAIQNQAKIEARRLIQSIDGNEFEKIINDAVNAELNKSGYGSLKAIVAEKIAASVSTKLKITVG